MTIVGVEMIQRSQPIRVHISFQSFVWKNCQWITLFGTIDSFFNLSTMDLAWLLQTSDRMVDELSSSPKAFKCSASRAGFTRWYAACWSINERVCNMISTWFFSRANVSCIFVISSAEKATEISNSWLRRFKILAKTVLSSPFIIRAPSFNLEI